MASFQVTCHTPDDINAELRIRGLGGQGWQFPANAIIEMIENRQHEFWVSLDNQPVELAVGRHGATGSKYLTTATGEFPPTGLLKLPVCQAEEERGRPERSRWAAVP